MSDGGADVGSSTPDSGRFKRRRTPNFLSKKSSREHPVGEAVGGEGSPSRPVKKRTNSTKSKQHKKSKSVEEKAKKEKTKKKKRSNSKRKEKESNESDPCEVQGREEEDEVEDGGFSPEIVDVAGNDDGGEGNFLRESKGKEEEARSFLRSSATYDGEFDSEVEEIESDGDDFIGDFEFHEDRPEKPFVCLQENEIADEQNREIQKISELLSVTVTQAAGLLRFFKWNKDKLLTSYFDDPDQALELAGVKVKTSTPNKENEMGLLLVDNRCSICDEEASEDLELFGMDCKHFFCGLCWEQYLTMQIQEGKSGLIPCPSYDCGLLVDEAFLKKLVPDPIYQKYLLFLTKSFVDGNSQVRWCPAPGCGNAVNTDSPVGQTVHCSCGHSFCFRCGEESHGPAFCEHVRDWNQKSQDESETNNWITANTQACPKCHTFTEKNGGCNHMTCSTCQYQYCWMCKKDWKGHYDFYTCNRFEKSKKKSKKMGGRGKGGKGKADKEAQAALEKEEHRQRLERYLHYYNQFMELDKMLGTVAKTREKINTTFQEWRDNDGTVAESLFVEKALNILATCWRALKWSCVRLYYFDDKNIRKNLFEFVKTDLEKSVNLLSEILRESPFEKIEVLDLTRLCETRLTNLLSWHNTCR